LRAEGNISQPTQVGDVEAYYPERWGFLGDQYKFTVRPTKAPPQKLVDEFYRATKSVDLHKVLGSYDIEKMEDGPAIIE